MATDAYYNEIFEPEFLLVRDFFKSHRKAERWFYASNPLLGNRRPIDMLYPKKYREKLTKFIKTQLAENHA